MTREQVEGWRQRLLFGVSHPDDVDEVNEVFDLALLGLDAVERSKKIMIEMALEQESLPTPPKEKP